ncbi:hypothetical protein SLEP1_g34767 [Rubroshorea leprosula]|uniref:Uncharacterized protein n=1 Tax=Rubroshorea leprosula TaxID=152421 RepID=A0AAV5KLA7_9ROSI|nr:hypothetical protein SLEP1_g34767 [Rubroshorea leprosula]
MGFYCSSDHGSCAHYSVCANISAFLEVSKNIFLL